MSQQVLPYDPTKPIPYQLTDEELGEKTYDVNPETNSYAEQAIINFSMPFAEMLNTNKYNTRDGKRPKLDENAFIKTWLPHFYQDNGPKGNQNNGDVVQAWVKAVATSIHAPVDIMRNGERIFTVPPMVGRLNAIGGGDRYKSMGELTRDMKKVVSRTPIARDAQIENILAHTFEPKDINDDQHQFITNTNLKYIYVMDEIFVYYGGESILDENLLKYKPLVFGEPVEHGTQPSGTLPSTPEVQVSLLPELTDEDEDLFG